MTNKLGVIALVWLYLCLGAEISFAGNIEGKRFKAWQGGCEVLSDNQEVCYLEQEVADSRGQLLLRAVLGYAPGRPHPTVYFELPAGIHIESGVSLAVGKRKPIRFKGRCSESLCTAGFILQGPAKRHFLKGRQARVSYLPGAGQPAITIPVSLMGVTAGMKALR